FLVGSTHVRHFHAKDLFIAAIVPGPTFLKAASWHGRRTPGGLLRFLVAYPACGTCHSMPKICSLLPSCLDRHFLIAASRHARRTAVVLRFLVGSTHVRDLSFCAKDLIVAAIDMFGVVQFLRK